MFIFSAVLLSVIAVAFVTWPLFVNEKDSV